MRKIQFTEDYATRLKGDVWDGCEAQLASELVRANVAVYIDEGERSAFKLNTPEGSAQDFVVTQEHLDNQPSLGEQGVKIGDKVIITATVIPCMGVVNDEAKDETIVDDSNDVDENPKQKDETAVDTNQADAKVITEATTDEANAKATKPTTTPAPKKNAAPKK